jgi:hypothetical protein
MLDGIVLWWLGAAPGQRFGPGLVPRAIETIGKVMFPTAIAPLLLLLFVSSLGQGLFASLREHRKTGDWPRNESFIARTKAQRNTPP